MQDIKEWPTSDDQKKNISASKMLPDNQSSASGLYSSLKARRDDANYSDLIAAAVRLVNSDHHNILKDPELKEVVRDLYQYISLRKAQGNHWFSEEIFIFLRELVKNSLMQSPDQGGFRVLAGGVDLAFTKLDGKLVKFKQKNLISRWLCSFMGGEEEDKLCEDIRKIIKDYDPKKLINIINRIEKGLKTIGYNQPLAKVLQEFKGKELKPLVVEYYILLGEYSGNSELRINCNVEKFRRILLDDNCYSLLDQKFFEVFVNHPKMREVFFDVIVKYRVDEIECLSKISVKVGNLETTIGSLLSPYLNQKKIGIIGSKYGEIIQKLGSQAIPSEQGSGTSVVSSVNPQTKIISQRREVVKGETASTGKVKTDGHSFLFRFLNSGLNRTPSIREEGYRLQDDDIRAGIVELKVCKENFIHSNLAVGMKKELISKLKFMPVEIFVIPSNDEYTELLMRSTLQMIEEVSKEKESFCFGIMNISNTHYVSIFVYHFSEYKQMIILDSLDTSDSKKIVEVINEIFINEKKNWLIEREVVTQQKNGVDCGICCLQNGKDLIEKGCIVIENNKLKLDRKKLTLNPEAANPPFDKKIIMIREEWEKCLSRVDKDCIFDIDNNQIPENLPYSFQTNKKRQLLIQKGQNIISRLVLSFYQQDLEGVFKSCQASLKREEEFEKVIKRFLDGHQLDCKNFAKICEEIEGLTDCPGESIPFSADSIKKELLKIINKEYMGLPNIQDLKRVAPHRPSPMIENKKDLKAGTSQLEICELLGTLIKKLEAYPAEPDNILREISLFFSSPRLDPLNKQAEVKEIIATLKNYQDEIKTSASAKQVEGGRWRVANYLLEVIKKTATCSLFGIDSYHWQEKSHGNLIKDELAKLVGLDPALTRKYDTFQQVEITLREKPIPLKLERQGYDAFVRLIEREVSHYNTHPNLEQSCIKV